MTASIACREQLLRRLRQVEEIPFMQRTVMEVWLSLWLRQQIQLEADSVVRHAA